MRSLFAYTGVLVLLTTSLARADFLDEALTPAKLSKFSPAARADIVAALVERKQDLRDAGIDRPERFFHFMAEIATETGGLKRIDENLNYSASGLLATFPKRMKPTKIASQLAKRPREIANFVYGGRLGNIGPDDGWTYRGSGLIQLTGRENFLKRGKEITIFDNTGQKRPGTYLVDNPQKVREMPLGLQTAAAYWKALKINAIVDQKKGIKAVRLAVNGGTNGLEQCKFWLAKAKLSFGTTGLESAQTLTLKGEEFAAVQGVLKELGYIKSGGLESGAANKTKLSDAIKSFEQDQELPAVGIEKGALESAASLNDISNIDEDTIYMLMDPRNFKEDFVDE